MESLDDCRHRIHSFRHSEAVNGQLNIPKRCVHKVRRVCCKHVMLQLSRQLPQYVLHRRVWMLALEQP